MNTYSNMIAVINAGKKTREELLNMNDIFLMAGRITEAQYMDLLKRIDAKYPVEA